MPCEEAGERDLTLSIAIRNDIRKGGCRCISRDLAVILLRSFHGFLRSFDGLLQIFLQPSLRSLVSFLFMTFLLVQWSPLFHRWVAWSITLNLPWMSKNRPHQRIQHLASPRIVRNSIEDCHDAMMQMAEQGAWCKAVKQSFGQYGAIAPPARSSAKLPYNELHNCACIVCKWVTRITRMFPFWSSQINFYGYAKRNAKARALVPERKPSMHMIE